MAKEKPKQNELAKSSQNTSQKKMAVVPRGRIFEGIITKKFSNRVVIELERTVYVPKYERFYRKKTRIHARLPNFMEKDVQLGDLIRVQECRPLSKIIHFIVLGKVVKEKGAKK
mgnify:CR=1 FL=1